MKAKKHSVKIECTNGIIVIDNIPEKRIKELALEQEQVLILKQNNSHSMNIKTLYRNPASIKIASNTISSYFDSN